MPFAILLFFFFLRDRGRKRFLLILLFVCSNSHFNWICRALKQEQPVLHVNSDGVVIDCKRSLPQSSAREKWIPFYKNFRNVVSRQQHLWQVEMSVCKLTGGHGMLKNRKRFNHSKITFLVAILFCSLPMLFRFTAGPESSSSSRLVSSVHIVVYNHLWCIQTLILLTQGYSILSCFWFFFSMPGMASSKLLVCRGSVSLSSEAQTYHQCNTPPEALIRMRPAFLFYCGYVGFH